MEKLKLLTWIALMTFHTAACQMEEIGAPTQILCNSDYPYHTTFEELLDSYQEGTIAPGSIIGIKKIGEPAWIGARGYSNLAHHSPMKVCTPFRTGSVTKMFTAALVLKLAEVGDLQLDDKVTTHLPGLTGKIPQIEDISIRQLLNHTSGLGHPTDDDLEYQLGLINNSTFFAELSPRQKLERYIFCKPLKHTPSTRTYYSNAGYWLLEWVVETATGKTFNENLNKHILLPLGLRDTYLSRKTDNNVARGYNSSGKNIMDVTHWDSADSDGDPAAGIISTAADLLVFGEGLFSGALLNEKSMEDMLNIYSAPECQDCGYGLGLEKWTLGKYTGFGMNGSSLGVDANLLHIPEQKTTLILFSNYGGGNRKEILEAFLKF
jgi:D-alanyl-D-alanine carboxypeptidase